MWNPFVFNDCNYLIKYSKSDSNLKVHVTDFRCIWTEDTSKDDILKRFQELNPLFDANSLSSTEIISRIESLIADIYLETNIHSVLKEDDRIILELKRKFQEFSIKYKFFLAAGDENVFFNEFTLPLMQSVQYLEVRQKKLFDLLEKKDREIQEHQLEGGEISRRNLITKKFDRNAILENAPEQLFVNVFGKSKVFLQTFINKFGSVANVGVKIDAENTNSNPNKKFKSEKL